MKKYLSVILLATILIFVGGQEKVSAEGILWWGKVVNCNEWISLRSEPSTSAPRLAKIPLGTTVKVHTYYLQGHPEQSPVNGFYWTQYNGAWGWCLVDYIRLDTRIY